MNLKMKILEKQLVDILSNSGLPIGTIYYMLKNLLFQIENLYNAQIEKEEMQQYNKQKQNNENVKEQIISQQINLVDDVHE